MTNDFISMVRSMVVAELEKLNYRVMPSPLETLRTIDFQIERSSTMDQAQVAFWNQNLDKKGCLGRVALAAAIVEKHFPDAKLEAGEVWQDWLAAVMLSMLKEKPERRFDPSFMQELLMYEDPHLVLIVDGVQFEPLSLELGMDIIHPRVQAFPIWEAIAASILVSQAWMANDPSEKILILKEAERVCPGMAVTRENICEPLEMQGQIDQVIDVLKWVLGRRPTARALYALSALTKDQKYYDALVDFYSEEVTKYF